MAILAGDVMERNVVTVETSLSAVELERLLDRDDARRRGATVGVEGDD
jgi:hypothetical protein